MIVEINNEQRILIKQLMYDFIKKSQIEINRIDMPQDGYYKELVNGVNTAVKIVNKL